MKPPSDVLHCTRENTEAPEIEEVDILRERSDKQPLPAFPSFHARIIVIVLLFNTASTELPAWPDGHTITQREWELRLSRHRAYGRRWPQTNITGSCPQGNRDVDVTWPSKIDSLSVCVPHAQQQAVTHECTWTHLNRAYEIGNNWPHWWRGVMESLRKAVGEKERRAVGSRRRDGHWCACVHVHSNVR